MRICVHLFATVSLCFGPPEGESLNLSSAVSLCRVILRPLCRSIIDYRLLVPCFPSCLDYLEGLATFLQHILIGCSLPSEDTFYTYFHGGSI